MKHIFILAICLLVAGSVSAQTYYYGPRRVHRRPVQRQQDDFYRPRIGIEAGLSIANTVDSYDASYSTDNILAFNAGLTATIPLVYPLSFQPEVLFSQKGYKAYTTDGTFTQRNNYVDIPLLANFRLVRGFNFLIGPQINIPVSTTNTFDNGFTISRESYYTDSSNKSYVAGVVGFSIDLNPNVDLHARYVLDLSSNTYDVNSPIPDYRNQVWQFGIGIKFQ
ncbi:MAG TPA: porin family protein [Mucilaginibacter sp.]|nr:porin family protein [Mucilaginibacter sp.]